MDLDIQKAMKSFREGGFEVEYFDTAAAATAYLCREIQNTSVGIGGSMTIKEMKLDERLRAANQVYWHWLDDSKETRTKASRAEVYLTSANALSENGEIINIDGSGNRVAATIYGPQRLYVICGTNKLEPDYDRALHRARNVASPLNARRLGAKTPCAVSEEVRCFDCKSPGRICGVVSVHWRRPLGIPHATVILIGESLGY